MISRLLALLALTIGSFLLANPLPAQGYTLQPGDTLRAQLIRLGDAAWTSMVDPEGYVRFPYIGRHLAAGKTLDALQEDIVLDVVGRRISFVSGSEETVIVLDEDSVFLDVAEYRPVTVLGAVRLPGRIEFRPGQTVRAAIGVAGGLSLVGDDEIRPERVAFLTARIAELQKTEAWLLLDLWRIRGQLDPEFAETPPPDAAQILETRLGPDVLEDIRLRIAEARRDRDRELEDIETRIALTEQRIDYLTRALEQYEVVSEGEEERLAGLLSLRDRGLAVSNSVNDARAGALSASSRLLETEADLSETRRELASLTEQRDTVDLELSQDLLAERARIQRSRDETRARLLGARQELTMMTGQVAADADGLPGEPDILLHRLTGGTVESTTARLDDLVAPGDMIEVLLGTSGP